VPSCHTGPVRVGVEDGSKVSGEGAAVNILVIINGAAYGCDATFNAIRLAGTLSKRYGVAVRVFLMGDGVTCAVAGQTVRAGG